MWEEYRAAWPDCYGYSRFCDLHRAWNAKLTATMRQVHLAGEKMFVDYAGSTFEAIDGTIGEIRKAQVFVAVLGASSYTYAEVTWSLPDWIGAHGRAFAFFGGVPRQVISDNLKSGVIKACFHEPQVNRGYAEMAAHYGTAVIPAGKPRDKAPFDKLRMKSRGRRPDRATLDPGQAREPAVLLAGRGRHPRSPRAAEPPHHAPSRHQPTPAVRGSGEVVPENRTGS